MAATRVITTNFLCKTPLIIRKTPSSILGLNISFNQKTQLVNKKRGFSCRALYKPLKAFQVKEEGNPETLDYRVFFHDDSGKKVSPWHDIPLHLGVVFSVSLVKYPKNQVQRWRLPPMRCTLQSSGTLRKESFDITHTISTGTMECFHRHGKTHLLQTPTLMVLLEIMIQLMWLKLVTHVER